MDNNFVSILNLIALSRFDTLDHDTSFLLGMELTRSPIQFIVVVNPVQFFFALNALN